MATMPENAPSVISENISEKPKRGRPTVMGPMETRGLKSIYQAGPRTLLNRHYMLRAMAALELGRDMVADNPYRYLFDIDVSNGLGKMRQTILTELGRVEDDHLMRKLADVICEGRMPTQKAIAFIRSVRFDGYAAPTARDGSEHATILANRIIETINLYARRYGIDDEDATAALSVAYAQIEKKRRA